MVEEAPGIKSFWVEPQDGKGVAPHKAGQFLPIRVNANGEGKLVRRTYTLSIAPSDKGYRISVKKDGLVSNWLHNNIKAGDTLEAQGPGGDFTIDLDEKKRGAVLIAAGIGITPMLAMLRSIVFEGVRTRGVRPTWLVYQTKDAVGRAFDEEINQLVGTAQGAVQVIRIASHPAHGEKPGVDFNGTGRLQAETFSQFLPFGDYDFYMCGPGGFMQSIYDGLTDMSVPDHRIHAEAFGPASLQRKKPATSNDTSVPLEPVSDVSVPVIFSESAKEARWETDTGTLLDLAEARGVDAPHSCRAGTCGACAIKMIKGKVAKIRETTAPTGEGEVLMCSVAPAKDSGPIELEV